MIFSVAVVLTLGCKQDPPKEKTEPAGVQVHQAEPQSVSPQSPLPPGHPPINDPKAAAATLAAKAPPAHSNTVSGTVLESIPAGKYLYLKLKTDKGEVWTAVPKADVSEGQQITVANAALMKNFNSKTLNRTFTEVWFGMLAPSKKPGAATAPAAKEAAPADKSGDTVKAEAKEAPSVDTSTAISVAKIYEAKAELQNKPVVVKGKVVKFNPGILQRNWIHIQDGSGDKAKGTHDITVTTQGTAVVGDTITAKGILILDKDFGGGYKYSVIIEKATLSK